jgi:hypothetical protein
MAAVEAADSGQAEVDAHEEFGHLIVWHMDIRNRQSRGQKFEPISLEAMEVYETRFLAKLGIEMTAFDWEMIWRIDSVWMDAVPKSPEEQAAMDRTTRGTRH